MTAARGHLGIIQSEKRLQVGHQVGVDALQRLEQRNSSQLCKRLLDLRPLLVEVKTPGRSQRSHTRSQRDHTHVAQTPNQDHHASPGDQARTHFICNNKADYKN